MSLASSRTGSMISLDLEGDVTVRHVLDNLAGRRGVTAVVRAINRAATHARAEAGREIPKKVQFRPAYLRERIEIRQARTDRPEAYILARRRGTLLSRFPYRAVQTTKVGQGRKRSGGGIQVTIKTGRPAKVLKSAFLVRLRSGRADGAGAVGIAVRNEVLKRLGIRAESEGGHGRRRYSVLHTTSVHDVYRDALPGIAGRITPFLQRQLLHELEFELNRSRRSR